MSSRAAAPVTAVVAAAGSGERLGAGGPKAFVPLAGRRLVEWSIAALRAAESVRSIVVACPPGRAGEVRDLPGWGADAARAGALVAVEGGATRSQSVRNGLEAVETELVAIHDAARPLVTPELIEDVVGTLLADPEAMGAIAATPVVDTVKRSDRAEGLAADRAQGTPLAIGETVERSALWAAQTPQVFRTSALREALAAYPAEAPEPTDEAMLVEAAGGRVLIHPSPSENLKVTTPLDLRVAELLLAAASR